MPAVLLSVRLISLLKVIDVGRDKVESTETSTPDDRRPLTTSQRTACDQPPPPGNQRWTFSSSSESTLDDEDDEDEQAAFQPDKSGAETFTAAGGG